MSAAFAEYVCDLLTRDPKLNYHHFQRIALNVGKGFVLTKIEMYAGYEFIFLDYNVVNSLLSYCLMECLTHILVFHT